jgi:hypothetical protein
MSSIRKPSMMSISRNVKSGATLEPGLEFAISNLVLKVVSSNASLGLTLRYLVEDELTGGF